MGRGTTIFIETILLGDPDVVFCDLQSTVLYIQMHNYNFLSHLKFININEWFPENSIEGVNNLNLITYKKQC